MRASWQSCDWIHKKVITIGESSCGETYLYNYYIIKEYGNYVKIEMKANHPTWGAPELSWKFPKETDQKWTE